MIDIYNFQLLLLIIIIYALLYYFSLIIIDARFTGYEFHDELNYSISYPSIGDCLDRYIPRFNEIIECCRQTF